MPVLVGDLLDQPVHGLDLAAIERIPQLPAMHPQLAPQLALVFGEVAKRGGFPDTQLIQSGLAAASAISRASLTVRSSRLRNVFSSGSIRYLHPSSYWPKKLTWSNSRSNFCCY